MRSSTWLRLRVCLLLLVALTAASCSGESSTVTSPNSASAPESSDPSTTRGTDATGTTMPTASGERTVTIVEPVEVRAFDPIMSAGAVADASLFTGVFETLAITSPGGDVIPVLAENWTVSDDARTFTFVLREGITFHNGNPLDAEDVVYSVERALEEGIPQITQRGVNIDTVMATDDRTVVFTLIEPDSTFIYTLADNSGLGFASILDRDQVSSPATTPVGTGPFRFASYAPAQEMVLEVNRDYWNPSLLPDYDVLRIRFISEDAAQVAALNAGEVALIEPLSAATVQTLLDDPSVDVQQLPRTGFWINLSRVGATEPTEVAQAVALSIDRQQLADIVFFGTAVPGSTVHPSVPYALPVEELPNYERDVDRARELLAQAGHPDGIELSILYSSRPPFQDVFFETLQSQLAEAGIRITLEPVEQAVWLPRFINAEYDISVTDQSWYSNPVRFLLPRDGWQAPPEEILPELPPLLAELSAASEAERPAVFQEIQRLEAEAAYPFIGTVWVSAAYVHRPDLIDAPDVSQEVAQSRLQTYLTLRPAG